MHLNPVPLLFHFHQQSQEVLFLHGQVCINSRRWVSIRFFHRFQNPSSTAAFADLCPLDGSTFTYLYCVSGHRWEKADPPLKGLRLQIQLMSLGDDIASHLEPDSQRLKNSGANPDFWFSKLSCMRPYAPKYAWTISYIVFLYADNKRLENRDTSGSHVGFNY